MAWADPLAGHGPAACWLRMSSASQHPPNPGPRQLRPPPSTAFTSAAANHATRASVSQPTLHVNTSSPITGFPSTYLRLPRVDLRSSTGVNLRFAFHSEEFAVTAETLTRAGAQDAHVVVSRISAEEMNKSDDSRATVRGELLLHTA